MTKKPITSVLFGAVPGTGASVGSGVAEAGAICVGAEALTLVPAGMGVAVASGWSAGREVFLLVWKTWDFRGSLDFCPFFSSVATAVTWRAMIFVGGRGVACGVATCVLVGVAEGSER